MRKSKEQVQQERQEREENREALKLAEYAERVELKARQQRERDLLRERQAARRKEEATTGAGGFREGAGRPVSLPHAISIKDGRDENPRKTMTFYGAKDEKEPVKRFLQVWRKLRFETSPEERAACLQKISGLVMYQLMTGQAIEPQELEKLPPELAKIGGEPLPL